MAEPLSTEAQRIAKSLGLSEDDIEATQKMQDSSFLNIPDPPEMGKPGPRVICTVMSNELAEVTTQFGTSPALKVKDAQGIPAVIPMGSKSLKMQYFRWASKTNLVGRRIVVWKEYYMHETYKKTIAYRIELLPIVDEPTADESQKSAMKEKIEKHIKGEDVYEEER